MLTYLRITGLALVDELELPLSPGFTVITGETGAGKSIIVDALGLLRGGRASSELIRRGCDQAVVEASWQLDAAQPLMAALAQAGRAQADDLSEGLIIRRVVSRSGRARSFLAGRLATLSELAESGGRLVDITSQHDQQSLMDPESQMAIADAFAGNSEHLATMGAAYKKLADVRTALEAFDKMLAARSESEDFLRFQLSELREASLQPGEVDALRSERERVKSAERFAAAAIQGEALLYSDDGAASSRLSQVAHDMEALAEIAPDAEENSHDGFAALADRLRSAQAEVDDIAQTLARLGTRFVFDPQRLQEIEERLAVISHLIRKHGGSESTALEKEALLSEQLDALESHEATRQEKSQAVSEALVAAQVCAARLSERREEVARSLSQNINATLQELGLKGAELSIEVDTGQKLGPRGSDRIVFQFAPNPGEPPRPLARIASGGELSRVMLAVKGSLSVEDPALTYVFDEVDTGVGGGVAEVIGSKLQSLSKERQVLAVTHLAQIAAFADHHLKVEKRVENGRTRVGVTLLDERGRSEELARMLGGSELTSEARAHAEQMLLSSRSARKRPAKTHAESRNKTQSEPARPSRGQSETRKAGVARNGSSQRAKAVPSERRASSVSQANKQVRSGARSEARSKDGPQRS